MPAQTLAFALAASIYPPAVAAVIALGRGPQVRSRVFAFVLAAAVITYASGTLLLLVLVDLGATGPLHWTPSAALDLALGLVLLGLAFHLHHGRPEATAEAAPSSGPSRIERYLRSRRLALVLGFSLYLIPSPIYVAAVKTIADAGYSTSRELVTLLATVVVMLWLIEVPMVMLLAAPDRASDTLEQLNLWFARRARLLAVVLSAGAGVYLAIRGLHGLIG